MNFGARQRSRISAFDLTPMIDVVLQLIIFFLFTTHFGELTRTAIDLPREPGEERTERPPPTFVIDLDDLGRYLIQSEPVSLDRLVSLVREEVERSGPDNVSVQVRPDRLSRARDMNALTRRLAELGVARWSIATVPEGKEGSP
ncbi:MAG: biopolymer transporter ExbD [Phycisphaerales bacterium]